MDTFPDLGSLTDQELKELIKQLTDEEMEISYRRRILHGKIDILRAELVNRLRKKDETGELVITGPTSSSSRTSWPAAFRGPSPNSRRPVAQHCPECGFANDEGANYCQRCGAFLAHSDPPPGTTTATYKLGETGELEEIDARRRHRPGAGAGDPRRGRSSRRELPARQPGG